MDGKSVAAVAMGKEGGKVRTGPGAWGMGAWGMGHGAWGMGHGAWGMAHGGGVEAARAVNGWDRMADRMA
jgi:hypothetical protein